MFWNSLTSKLVLYNPKSLIKPCWNYGFETIFGLFLSNKLASVHCYKNTSKSCAYIVDFKLKMFMIWWNNTMTMVAVALHIALQMKCNNRQKSCWEFKRDKRLAEITLTDDNFLFQSFLYVLKLHTKLSFWILSSLVINNCQKTFVIVVFNLCNSIVNDPTIFN